MYCTERGARIPTVRELALLSMSFGAKGIAEYSNGKPDDSYDYIGGKNSYTDGSLDKFYYSAEGYRRPAGDLGGYWFWSATVAGGIDYYPYFLNGSNGRIFSIKWHWGDGESIAFKTVRCVKVQ